MDARWSGMWVVLRALFSASLTAITSTCQRLVASPHHNRIAQVQYHLVALRQLPLRRWLLISTMTAENRDRIHPRVLGGPYAEPEKLSPFSQCVDQKAYRLFGILSGEDGL
jgi:hypothetical protein